MKRNFLSSNRLPYYLLLSRRLLDDAANPFKKKWGRFFSFIGQNRRSRRSRHAANADAPRHAAYVRPLILVNYTGPSPAPLFIIIFSFSFFFKSQNGLQHVLAGKLSNVTFNPAPLFYGFFSYCVCKISTYILYMHGSDIRLLDPLRASIGGPKALLGF